MDPQRVKLERFENGVWWLTTESGKEYQVVRKMNSIAKANLETMLENGGVAFLTLQSKETSGEILCCISPTEGLDFWDEDAYCRVTDQTGNRNPNAEADIRAATHRMRKIGILKENS